MRTDDVHVWLDRFPPPARAITLALREVIRHTIPDAEETLVWGCLSYHLPEIGGRVKGAVCQIVVRRGTVRLDFIHGARIRDPKGLLQGTLKSKRFLPIGSEAHARRREVAALLRSSASTTFRFAVKGTIPNR